MVNGGFSVTTSADTYTSQELDMIPKSLLTVNPPTLKTVEVSIPGADGKIDLTDALDGTRFYSNRSGEWKFLVTTGPNRTQAYTNCLSVFNGELVQVVLDDDPSTTYTGRLYIDSWKSWEGFADMRLRYVFEVGDSYGT